MGQPQAKEILKILCTSARMQKKPICHSLLSGRPGLGKTTLCRILAIEMDANLIELVAPNLTDPQQLTAQLAQLKEGDILFIDEIHSLPRAVEEILYSAMEDGCITMVVESEYGDLMKNLGMSSKQTRTVVLNLPPFTLMGATTLSGLLSAPLRSRFVQTIELEPYSQEELTEIVLKAANRMHFKIEDDAANAIANRSRNTARIAIAHLKWVFEYCNATSSPGNLEAVKAAFLLKGIDEYGLTKTDRNYLKILVDSKKPVGLNTLSASLGESTQTITMSIEPFLLQEGYICRANRGRIAEQRAFNVLSEVQRV